MKLFRIENGFVGSGNVHIYAIAEDEARAIEIAKPVFMADAQGKDPRFTQHLKCEVVFEDTTIENVGDLEE